MFPAHDPAHIWDMLDGAQSVLDFVGEKTLEDYLEDGVLQAAVERKIEIIGEAARKVSDEFKQSHPEIPWRRIIGQRHVLAREYGEINHKMIWNLIKESIPQLIRMLEPLLPPIPV
jgi:uncharacterized protein with HEPN domain